MGLLSHYMSTYIYTPWLQFALLAKLVYRAISNHHPIKIPSYFNLFYDKINLFYYRASNSF